MEEPSPLDAYAMLSVIGKGSYAKVILVRKKDNGQLYAIKSMKKKYIEQKNQVKRVMMERDILTQIDHPFLIKIHSAFQDEKKIFLVLEYCQGGQLFGLLSKRKRLTELETRFYAAQILLALEYLHSKNIIYRDLKPQNVLIGADGYIKLTDFGLSKNNIVGDFDTFSVCGTPEYLAPEVVKKEGHGKAVDWWCLGSLIYELVHGLPPFYTKNRSELFERIKKEQPYMTKTWSPALKDILSKLFTKSPTERMKHVASLKTHPWFQGIDWQKLLNKEIAPLFVPVIHCESDVSHFDREFTSCSIESHTSSFGDAKKFEGFSFQHRSSPQSNMEPEKEDSDGQIVFTVEDKMEQEGSAQKIGKVKDTNKMQAQQ